MRLISAGADLSGSKVSFDDANISSDLVHFDQTAEWAATPREMVYEMDHLVIYFYLSTNGLDCHAGIISF